MKISLIPSVLVPDANRRHGKTAWISRPSFLVILAASITLAGCKNAPRQEEDSERPSAVDHVSQPAHLTPQVVTHGLSKLQRFVKFPFDVPPHVITPRVTGEFTSFIQCAGGARIADDSANVELMIMTDEQFDAFDKKTGAESVYAIEPSHDHAVSITLPATEETPAHYYAVFRRTNEGKNLIWVNANLTAEFEAQ